MWFPTLSVLWRSRSKQRPARRMPASTRLAVEPLDDRSVPALLAPVNSVGGGALTVADLNRAITLLACGHDTAEGEIRLENDEASVRWPNYSAQACRAEMAALVAQYASAASAKLGSAQLSISTRASS